MQNISIIVAITENFAIGKGNDLLVHIPGDLKRFKEITSGHSIIMGRKTLLSLPKWPLPNRRNIVVTQNKEATFEGCDVMHSIEDAIKAVENEEEAFVIGGGNIYEQFYPIAHKLYLTVVKQTMEADVFFPKIDWEDWEEVEREDIAAGEKADFAYSYITLVRKPN